MSRGGYRLNSRQGKAGDMIGHAFDQIRGQGLAQQVLQITASDGQKDTALVDDAHLAEQDRFISYFCSHNFSDDPYHYLSPGLDQVVPDVMYQPGGVCQFHQIQAGKLALIALLCEVLYEGVYVDLQLFFR